MIDLTGKTAIVTGAGSGFGASIAKLFAELGANVLGGDINEAAVSAIAAEVTGTGGQMQAIAMDVASSQDFQTAVTTAIDAYGALDIVVNNAGYTHRNMPMLEVDEATFDKVMQVNVKSIYLSAIHAIPRMLEQGKGAIVNIASTAGVRPRPGITWYNGSKGAVITLTKSMAGELGNKNIRVNAINPVMSATGMLDALLGGDSPEARKRITSMIPMGKFSEPIDVARATAFLASDAAQFITGATLEVDGGRCI